MNEFILEADLSAIAARASAEPSFLRDLPVDLMRAYRAPAAQIARTLRDNETRIAKAGATLLDGERLDDFVWPKQMHYAPSQPSGVHDTIERLHALQKPKAVPGKTGPRFLISSDGDAFAAVDLRTGEAFRGERLADLPVHYDFLQPLAGVERYVPPSEQQADVDAAKIMRELHDALVAHDAAWKSPERTEALNVFLTRLLFCLFADGAGILDRKPGPGVAGGVHPFKRLMMGPASAKDGSGTAPALAAAFRVLDMRDDDPRRADMEPLVRALPYANGRLFEANLPVPVFDRRSRHALRRALDLDWSEINADIFGSMLQAVASDGDRSHFGMHYTSVPNIMKVIGPLFVDALENRLVEAGQSPRKLRALLDDLSAIHVFDPACGSGNFLIIAYQSLRSIETRALARLNAVQPDLALRSRVRLDHFHGIDPVDFSCRTARLSLWISQIKADRELAVAGIAADAILPLHDAGDIHVGNAVRMDWTKIVDPTSTPVYLVGNPPYLGKAERTAEQKEDMTIAFSESDIPYGKLDYVSCWFAKGANYVRNAATASMSFVATSSIVQGEHVSLLWPLLLGDDLEIPHAHTSFRWSNSASANAGVACVIVALGRQSKKPKTLFRDGTSITCDAIGPYLNPGKTVIVHASASRQDDIPRMTFGNMPRDGGNLILSADERRHLINKHPEAARFIRDYVGSQELIRDERRWCLWIDDDKLTEAITVPEIARRIEAVRTFRLSSRAQSTVDAARTPHRFVQIQGHGKHSLVIPRVSSERRLYIPIGMLNNGSVIADSAFAIYDADPRVMAILSTSMHMTWTKAVGGRLEDRIRYSNTLVYNTFPIPDLDDTRRATLDELALRIIETRQPHLDDGHNIAWLYNPETMPDDLRVVHDDLDEEFEGMYIGRRFRDDTERLEHLFRLYTRMKGSTK